MLYKIYKIENKVTGEVYIGQTRRSVKQRFSEQKSAKNLVGEAIRNHGKENFIVTTLFETLDINKACEVEVSYIKELNTIYPNGYNKYTSGAGTYVKQEKTIEKMRISNKRKHTEETKRKLSDINKGKKHTVDSKRKISESLKKNPPNKGKVFSEEHRRRIGEKSKGRVQSPEAKRKNSEKNSGKNNANYGKKHSPEMRAYISQRVKEALRKKKEEEKNGKNSGT